MEAIYQETKMANTRKFVGFKKLGGSRVKLCKTSMGAYLETNKGPLLGICASEMCLSTIWNKYITV